MQPEESLILSSIWWLLETGAAGIWGTLCFLVLAAIYSKAKVIGRWCVRTAPEYFRRVRKRKPGVVRRFFRGFRHREQKWVRDNRFDTTWIEREVSRGHTYLVIFIIWFGLWLVALGLRKTFTLSDAPLDESPGLTILIALPMYAFEIGWLYCSLRADKLIRYRKRVRIWRWWH